MAHKGKATSDVTYNPYDGPERIATLPSTTTFMSTPPWHRRSMGQIKIQGPRTEDINGDVLMRVGGGKRHGWY
jgi:hypothetical protein